MTYSGAFAGLRGEDLSTSLRGPFWGMGYARIQDVLKEMTEHTESDLLESN